MNKDWLAMSHIRSNVEQINDKTDFVPYDYREGAGYVESDGHYGLFDYLYFAVKLRDDELEKALDIARDAMYEYMNSDNEGIESVTLPPEFGGLTYYFVKTFEPQIHSDY